MLLSFDRHSGLTVTFTSPSVVRVVDRALRASSWLHRLRIPTPLLVFNLVIAPACQTILMALSCV